MVPHYSNLLSDSSCTLAYAYHLSGLAGLCHTIIKTVIKVCHCNDTEYYVDVLSSLSQKCYA